uniref:Caprin-1_dimer domain-containing protein n=1 Tax=Haemonchus contortus TaxID=6289 RepID=A0A7I5EEE3_HAECO
MKVDPDGLLASLIESPILLKPYASIENQLENKAKYVQTRLGRLQQYEGIANAGLPLTVSQNEARSKIDEVLKHLEYVKHLLSIVQRDRTLFEKSIRAADILITNKLDSFRSTTISHAYVYGEILTQLTHPTCTKAFLDGTDGAVTLTQKELDGLNRLRWAFFPSYCDCESLEQVETRADEASYIVAAILNGSNAVVDKQSELRGHEALTLLEKVKQSDFFSSGSWPMGVDDEYTDSEDPSALPSIPESQNEGESPQPSFNNTDTENDNSLPISEDANTKTGDSEIVASEEIKSVVNSIASEEAVGEQTSNSSPVSAPTTEINDDHNDSTNMSDSGNGTVSPDCEVAPDAKTELNKISNNVLKEKRKFRGGYNRSGETGTYQERERNDQRTYPTNRMQNGGNFTSSQPRQGNFPRRRADRSGLMNNMGTQDGAPYSDYWRSDGRANYSRPDRYSNYQNPVPFTYEPGVSRRPGPPVLGFIFANR